MLLAVSVQHMVKKISQYIIGYLIALVVLGFVAMFVPPVWAGCECTYNEVKGFLVFPASAIAALIIVGIAYIGVRLQANFWKSFVVGLLFFVVIFIILGYQVPNVADYIITHDLPIFRPTYKSIDI